MCQTSREYWWVPSTSHQPGDLPLSSRLSETPPPRSHLLSEASLRPWEGTSTTWHHLPLPPNISGFPRLVWFSKGPLYNRSTTVWPPKNYWKVSPSSSKHGSSCKITQKTLWWSTYRLCGIHCCWQPSPEHIILEEASELIWISLHKEGIQNLECDLEQNSSFLLGRASTLQN